MRPSARCARHPADPAGSLLLVSPLASETDTSTGNLIITVSAEAQAELVQLRDDEPDGDRLGLRLEIVSGPGEDFRYDLSFDVVTKAAFSDEVRTHRAPTVRR